MKAQLLTALLSCLAAANVNANCTEAQLDATATVESTSAAPSSELRRSLAWLAEQAEKRQASRGDYESVAGEILGRAREHFGPSEVEFQVFAMNLTETLRNQIGRLEEKVKERNATRKDFNEIVDMLMSRAREVNGI